MRATRRAVASTISAYLGLLVATAHAQDDAAGKSPAVKQQAATPVSSEISGVVVSIDEDDIVVDLGASRGAADGNVVDLWRPFRLRHPVTGQMLTDRFRIGVLRLVQVQKTLALARPEAKLARAPAPGDIVILNGPSSAPVRNSLETMAASKPSSPTTPGDHSSDTVDTEARELSLIFEALKGQGIIARIQRYEQYAQARPAGRYTRVLLEEANALRRLQAGARPEEEAAKKPRTAFLSPQSALANTPLTLGVETAFASGAVLHVRHAGEVAYQSVPMRAAGAGYFRATIPGAQMKSPEVSYFIESVNAAGVASSLVGMAESPLAVDVHDAPRPDPPASPDASVAIFTDYADYNRMRANDYAWQTEGAFGLRYGDIGVRAVRSGFGVYRGVGGSIHELDELGLTGRKVGLTYGYLEGEFGTSNFVGLIGRVVLGLTDEGVDGGGQFFLRLGNDKKTNLLLGGEILGGIGLKGIAELQWNTIARVPIVIRTEVTNQPAGSPPGGSTPAASGSSITALTEGDIGARAMLQVGYRIVPSCTLALRGSYEGRTIQHAGPGAGAGVSYTW